MKNIYALLVLLLGSCFVGFAQQSGENPFTDSIRNPVVDTVPFVPTPTPIFYLPADSLDTSLPAKVEVIQLQPIELDPNQNANAAKPDKLRSPAAIGLPNNQVNAIGIGPIDDWVFPVSYSEGEIPASGNVSSTGAFQYTVPIEIPAGIAGKQPSISLVYNSQGGEGIAGMGWNLSGLSGISTIPSTLYYHGETAPAPTLQSSSYCYKNLALDGQRLVYIGSISISTGFICNYVLENDNKYKIDVEFNSASSAIKATAYAPDGTVSTYGYADNAGLRLMKVETLDGNYIDYSYSYTYTKQYINSIQYGGNSKTGTTHFAIINFIYEVAPQQSFYYFQGAKYINNNRIKRIECYTNGNLYRKYVLSYNTGYFSQLSQIDLTAYGDSGQSSLSPLKFNYGVGIGNTQVNNTEMTLTPYYSTTNAIVRSGRFLSQSGTIDDILVLPAQFDYKSSQGWISGYAASDAILVYDGTDASYAGSLGMRVAKQMQVGSGFRGVLIANIDDTPQNEIITINTDISSSYEKLTFASKKPYSLGFYDQKSVTYNLSNRQRSLFGYFVIPKRFLSGDFDGDGHDEILAVEYRDSYTTASSYLSYIFDLNEQAPVFNEAALSLNEKDRIFVVDYDGDGKADICIVSSSGTHIYTFRKNLSKSGRWPYSLSKIMTVTGIKSGDLDYRTDIINDKYPVKKQLLVGDINGDGKTDFLLTGYCRKDSDGSYSVVGGFPAIIYYSNGGGGFETVALPNLAATNVDGGAFLQDINNDGRADLITSDDHKIYVYRLNANGFVGIGQFDKNITGGVVTTVEYTSPNNNRFFAHVVDSKLYRFNFKRDEQQEALLTKATSSRGVASEVSYRRLGENSPYAPICPEGSNTLPSPYRYLTNAGIWMVNTYKIKSGEVSVLDNSFSYSGTVVHTQGLGFCGLTSMSCVDNLNFTKNFQQTFDPLRRGVMVKVESSTQTVNNTWQVDITSNKEVKARLMGQTDYDRLTGFTTTTSYTYNGYGLPLTIEKNYGGIATQKTTNTYYDITYGGKWLIGLPNSVTVQSTRNGSSFTQKNQAYYNTSYLLQQRIGYTNDLQMSDENFTYDNFGNIKTQSIRAFNSSDVLTTTNSYTTNGRFLQQQTDAMGLTKKWEYGTISGLLVKETNHKGNSTTYEYDPLGRLTKASFPDGTQSTVSQATLVWFSTGENTKNAKYTVTASQTGEPTKVIYYDIFGREISRSVQGFDGSLVWTNTRYNAKGFVEKVSEPHFNDPTRWTNYTYDDYGRVKSIVRPSGRNTNYTYLEASVTTNDAGLSTTKTYNAMGEVVSVSDPAGSISYIYRPDGQPLTITAPDGAMTSFEYDNYGRQTKIIDPSAGTQSYTYDAAGNLYTQTDANSKTTTMTYNKFGQELTRTLPEYTITNKYTSDYDLSSITATNGTSTVYTYDNLGRIETETEGVDNQQFVKTYGYNGGKLSSVTYSPISNKPLKYIYNNYGYLSEMTLDGSSFWKADQMNHFGQTTKETLGNGTTVSHNYTVDGFPSSIVTLKDYTLIQNDICSFTPSTGLLYSRNNIYGQAETFSYDGLNRLSSYGKAGQSPSIVAYNNMGNITSKPDVGILTYNVPNKPYAIGKVSGSGNNIPTSQQDINYTSFSRPARISENGRRIYFTYDGSGNRVKTELYRDDPTLVSVLSYTRYYLGGNYEKETSEQGSVKERLYLGGSAYSAPAVYCNENGTWRLYYLHRDYLGSITQVSNENGQKVAEYSYDAWGRLRNPQTLAVYVPGQEPALMFNRGYTGHEHLPEFELINMNARLYDPVLGRFLAPDPYVQAPFWSQNFNRYTYAMNNPLLYTDPSGELFGIDDLIGAVIGGVVNLTVNIVQGNISGSVWECIGQGAAAFGAGAAAGALATYGPAGWAGGGAILGATNTWLQNKSGTTMESLFTGTLLGTVSGFAGGAVGQWAANSVGSVVINQFQVSSHSIIGGFVTGTIGGAAGGFAGGYATGLMLGYGLKGSLEFGWQGAIYGGAIGGAAGAANGYRLALKNGSNIWTGKSNIKTSTPIAPKPSENAQASQPSEKVQKVMETLHEIEANGGTVKVNQTSPSQDLNMTIEQNGQKLNIRIETHPLPVKYGGDNITPMFHMNVDPIPQFYPRLPNNGHILLNK